MVRLQAGLTDPQLHPVGGGELERRPGLVVPTVVRTKERLGAKPVDGIGNYELKEMRRQRIHQIDTSATCPSVGGAAWFGLGVQSMTKNKGYIPLYSPKRLAKHTVAKTTERVDGAKRILAPRFFFWDKASGSGESKSDVLADGFYVDSTGCHFVPTGCHQKNITQQPLLTTTQSVRKAHAGRNDALEQATR